METARLIIRTPAMSDVDQMMAIEQSEFVLKYNAMTIRSREEFESNLQRGIEAGSVFYLEEKESGRLVGGIFIEPDELRYRVKSYCLSYYLGETYGGKGYMTEALGAVIAYLFDDKQVDVVSARVFADNEASIRLLKKLGFVNEGCLRHCVCGYGEVIHDDMIFSILQSEYLTR